MENHTVTEHPLHKDFYISSFMPYAAINKEGKCVSLITNNFLTNSCDKDSYPRLLICFRNKKRKKYFIHRLLALIFIPKPEHLKHIPFSKLQVNHIDGVKTNYTLSNLEWVTSKGNVRHAVENNLAVNLKAVLAKHVITNEIIKFKSINDCSKYFKLNYTTLNRNLISEFFGKVTKDWYVFKYDNDKPWPILSKNDIVENKFNYGRIILVKNINKSNDIVYIFNNLMEASSFVGINYYALVTWRRHNGKDKPYQGWIFETRNNVNGVNINNFKKRVNNIKKCKSFRLFKIVNKKDNSIWEDLNLEQACKVVDLSFTGLNKMVKQRNGIYEDFIITYRWT